MTSYVKERDGRAETVAETRLIAAVGVVVTRHRLRRRRHRLGRWSSPQAGRLARSRTHSYKNSGPPRLVGHARSTWKEVVTVESFVARRRPRSGELVLDVLKESGAGDGTRTRDLLITNQLLYQLSYAGQACNCNELRALLGVLPLRIWSILGRRARQSQHSAACPPTATDRSSRRTRSLPESAPGGKRADDSRRCKPGRVHRPAPTPRTRGGGG